MLNGSKFKLLKTLKKLNRTSIPALSPKNPTLGKPNRLTSDRSVSKYLGPNNVLRPIIGRLANGFDELNAVLKMVVPGMPKIPPGRRKLSFELELGFTPGELAASADGRGSQN